MAKWLVGTILMIGLRCRNLEIDWDLCLALWRSRPLIEVVQEHPGMKRQRLYDRIDMVYPF